MILWGIITGCIGVLCYLVGRLHCMMEREPQHSEAEPTDVFDEVCEQAQGRW